MLNLQAFLYESIELLHAIQLQKSNKDNSYIIGLKDLY